MLPVRLRVTKVLKLCAHIPRRQSVLRKSTSAAERVKHHVKKALDDSTNYQLCNVQFVSTNGMQCGLFSDAENVMVQQGLGVFYHFGDVFSSGIQVANKFVERGYASLTPDEKLVVGTLINYFDHIGKHETVIKDVHYAQQYYCSDDAEAETIVCFVEHLLKWLVPTQKYVIDQSSRQTKSGCCSCGTQSSYGATGSGNPLVWHGNLDLVIDGSFQSQCVIKFCPSTMSLEDREVVQDTLWEVLLCNPSVYDLEEEKLDQQLEQKTQILNETVAQTVTFSFLQRLLQKRKHYLTPCVMMDKISFDLFLYDCEKDVLLKSVISQQLFMNEYTDKYGRQVHPNLNPSAVVYLWLILNHGLFCSEIPTEISTNFQSGFHSLVGEKLQIYKKDMRNNIKSFPVRHSGVSKSKSLMNNTTVTNSNRAKNVVFKPPDKRK